MLSDTLGTPKPDKLDRFKFGTSCFRLDKFLDLDLSNKKKRFLIWMCGGHCFSDSKREVIC